MADRKKTEDEALRSLARGGFGDVKQADRTLDERVRPVDRDDETRNFDRLQWAGNAQRGHGAERLPSLRAELRSERDTNLPRSANLRDAGASDARRDRATDAARHADRYGFDRDPSYGIREEQKDPPGAAFAERKERHAAAYRYATKPSDGIIEGTPAEEARRRAFLDKKRK